jgi:hypothetical protein
LSGGKISAFVNHDLLSDPEIPANDFDVVVVAQARRDLDRFDERAMANPNSGLSRYLSARTPCRAL